MNPSPSSINAAPDRRLRLVKWVWGIFAVLAIIASGIGAPLRYQELVIISTNAVTSVGQLRPQDLDTLNQARISVEFYAGYFTVAELLLALVFTLVALVIFWRRADEWIELFTATVLLTAPLATPIISSLERARLIDPAFMRAIHLGFALCIISFPFVFPDGRIVPRIARGFIGVWIIYAVLCLIFPALMPPTSFGARITAEQVLPMMWTILSFGVGVVAQVYRYRRISTLTQRQQTKWVVWGFAVWLTCFCVGIFVLITWLTTSDNQINLLARMAAPVVIMVGIVVIPLAIAFSILRYRLFDIDLIIRRTLIYSILTTMLALFYFASIIVLQQIFRGITGQESDLAIIVSTLAIAALFNPLRHRVQDTIDHRFYRRKYDAQQVLARFAATARDEVELEKLTGELLNVVNETMQPTSASLWLKKDSRGK